MSDLSNLDETYGEYS